MAKKRTRLHRPVKSSTETPQQVVDCYEGEHLENLLLQLAKSIESAKVLKGALPEKIWIKQQFAVGINDVTRVLERMLHVEKVFQSRETNESTQRRAAPLVPLQAIILAADCNPRWLTKHIQSLASFNEVPVIFVKDNKRGSLRLDELMKLKTAMAIGIKAKGSKINEKVGEILRSRSAVEDALKIAQPMHAYHSISLAIFRS